MNNPNKDKFKSIISSLRRDVQQALEHIQQLENVLGDNEHPITEPSIFSVFEQEIGRPLSPFEYEAISQWVNEFSEDLIKEALLQATLMQKVNIRYIERILLNWQKNNITTREAAKQFSREFRKGFQPQVSHHKKQEQPKVEYSFYNWIEKNGL